MSNPGTAQNNRLISFYQRHERIQSDIDERNADKKELYAEMKGVGFDTDAFKAVIKRLRAEEKNLAKVQESDYLQELYLNAIRGTSGTSIATRAPAQEHDPETGEIAEPPKPAAVKTSVIKPATQKTEDMPEIPTILRRGHPDCTIGSKENG